LIWLRYRRQGTLYFTVRHGPQLCLFRRRRQFCRGELSQLTVKRQAVDGPKAGFDNALFVK
jgi:hypothetical protein